MTILIGFEFFLPKRFDVLQNVFSPVVRFTRVKNTHLYLHMFGSPGHEFLRITIFHLYKRCKCYNAINRSCTSNHYCVSIIFVWNGEVNASGNEGTVISTVLTTPRYLRSERKCNSNNCPGSLDEMWSQCCPESECRRGRRQCRARRKAPVIMRIIPV